MLVLFSIFMFAQTEVEIAQADGEKCDRCWNYRILGADTDHPSLCERCAKVLKTLEPSNI